MNIIREIGISICVTAVATAIFQGLMPHSTLEKTARFVLSLFFICCLILPFTHYDFSDIDSLMAYQSDDAPVDSESLQETVNRNLIEMSEQAVRQTLVSIFEQNEIVPQEITVETNIEENNCISISKIIITVKPEDQAAARSLVPSLTTGEGTIVEIQA